MLGNAGASIWFWQGWFDCRVWTDRFSAVGCAKTEIVSPGSPDGLIKAHINNADKFYFADLSQSARVGVLIMGVR